MAGIAMLGSTAHANSTFTFTRLGGVNRFDTARIIDAETFPSGADTAIISTGYNFPDALAGNYLAGLKGAPILLVTQSDPIPAETLAALAALHTKNVIITGGTDAVGADVATTLASTATTAPGGGNINVSRVFGPNRYDTMMAIDETPGAPVGINTGILATGNNFPDALSAGGIAYHSHFPVILTDGSQPTLTPQAQAVITANHITHLIVSGGSAAINPAQYTNLPGVTVDEVAQGIDRSETSQLLADYSINHLGFSNTHFNLANGFNPATDLPAGTPAGFTPDALTGGPHSGVETGPIVLTLNPTTPGNATQFATEHAATLGTGHIFGGTAAVADSTATSITTSAGVATPTTLPPTPPGGGLGTNPVMNGPNLVSCTITANNFSLGAPSKIQFLFDKPVIGSAVAAESENYEIDGFNVTHAAIASSAAINASNPAMVDTTWVTTVDVASFTVCTVDNESPTIGAASASSGGGTANALETQLLGGSTVVPGGGTGATSCPDLTSAAPTVGDGTHTMVDYAFDKNVTAIDATGATYVLYDGAGVAHRGTAATLSLGGTVTTVTFGVNVTTSTRFAVLNGAATNATCFNPEGAVNWTGRTSPTPNLISVTRAGVNIFTFGYDQNVTLSTVAASITAFHVYTNTGVKFTAPASLTNAVQTSPTTIDVTFPGVTSSNTAGVVLGTDSDTGAAPLTPGTPAVTGTVNGLRESIGSAPIAITSPGPTDGPVPISATRDNAANNATITFNQPLCGGGCGASAPVPTNFYVIDANGSPTGAAGLVTVSGSTITLHWAVAGAIQNGVGVGVASGSSAFSWECKDAASHCFTATGAPGMAFGFTGVFNTDGVGNAPGTVALS